MLDSTLLKKFCSGFYGYGSNTAPYWFITMEEGGGKNEQDILNRLRAWDSRGRRELEEIQEYHIAIGQPSWFVTHPNIQKTWAAAIRMVLVAEGETPTTEIVRNFQRDRLARGGANNRLSPLFPLPSPSSDKWNYGNWTKDFSFSMRSEYIKSYENLRISHLSNAIRLHKPKFVVFFGTSYLHYWTRITGTPFLQNRSFLFAYNETTRFIACLHPSYQGVSNSYFESAASMLRDA